MIDVKQTIKNLHAARPLADAEELLQILDCIVEFPDVSNITNLETWPNQYNWSTYNVSDVTSVLNGE